MIYMYVHVHCSVIPATVHYLLTPSTLTNISRHTLPMAHTLAQFFHTRTRTRMKHLTKPRLALKSGPASIQAFHFPHPCPHRQLCTTCLMANASAPQLYGHAGPMHVTHLLFIITFWENLNLKFADSRKADLENKT